jgi:hypothetical protein
MIKYLIMKTEQHPTLLEELRVLRAEESALRRGKGEARDSVIKLEFGWVQSFFFPVLVESAG